MRNNLNRISFGFTPENIENLRRSGIIFFDVDDTLLARRTNRLEKDQIFADSEAAQLIPLLLQAKIRVCIITGHGWKQLQKRLVAPLVKEIFDCFYISREQLLRNFFIYANRGATKIVWENGDYLEHLEYRAKYAFTEPDLSALRKILRRLGKSFEDDFARRQSWHLKTFGNFPFDELPPEIIERESVVLGLRPLPSEFFSSQAIAESPRQILFSRGCEILKNANLDSKYELAQSGKSTLEIMRRQVSKKNAFQDLLNQISAECQTAPEQIEQSSVYIGDEFSADGNDYVIARDFPRCRCFSVAAEPEKNLPGNVFSVNKTLQIKGVPATSAIISAILKVLT